MYQDDRRPEGEKQRVPEPFLNGRGDILRGESRSQTALEYPEKPAEVSNIRWIVQPQFLSEVLKRLGRRQLAKNGLRDITGQEVGADEDECRDRE